MKSKYFLSIFFVSFSVHNIISLYDGQVDFFKQLIQQGNLVFDIGAHHGDKTDLFLKNGAHVVGFEPFPELAEELRLKYANNPSVTIEEIALSSNIGTSDFFICSECSGISTISQEWINDSRFAKNTNNHMWKKFVWDKKINVKMSTLDEMIKHYGIPVFIKIDVENHEYEVLSGLNTPVKYLSFEFHQEMFNNAKKCLEHLSSLGYKKFNFAVSEFPYFELSDWVIKR